MKLFGTKFDQRSRVAALASSAFDSLDRLPPPAPSSGLKPGALMTTKAAGGSIPREANPFSVIGPPVEAVPTRQAIFLNPRWEPINIARHTTAREVQKAIEEAENGEPRDLFRFYRDTLMGDDHIQGCCNTRKLALLAQPPAIMPEDKANPADRLAAAACARLIKQCSNWMDGCSALLGSFLWPVTIAEKLYTPAEGVDAQITTTKGDTATLRFLLRQLAPVNPQLFCYRWAYLTGGVSMGTASPLQQAQLREQGPPMSDFVMDLEKWEPALKLWPIDANGRIIYDTSTASYLDKPRHIVHRAGLLTEFRDNWGGPMRCILGWWLLRQLGRDWFGQFMQRYGSPFLKGKVNVEDPQAVQFMRDAMQLSARLGGIVIDHDDELELEQAMYAGGAEGHEKWGNTCDRAIARYILGQELSTTAKSTGLGSSVGDLQSEVRQDYRLWDQSRFGETLENQLFRPFLDLNGLPGQCKIVWGGLSDEAAEATGALLVSLAQAGLEPADEALPTIEDRIGFGLQRKAAPSPNDPELEDDDKTKTARLSASALSPQSSHLSDLHAPALAALLKGAHAPLREIILTSASREECLARAQKMYSDWHPARVTDLINQALQQAARTQNTNRQ